MAIKMHWESPMFGGTMACGRTERQVKAYAWTYKATCRPCRRAQVKAGIKTSKQEAPRG